MKPANVMKYYVRFEVFTAVTMKNAVFWDVAPCRFCVNRRFRGKYRLHLQGRKIREGKTSVSMWLQTAVLFLITLKAEAIRSSETSVHTILQTAVCNHLLTLVPRSRIFLH
jgi:hypothetical protein